jgi:hypothetical protein
MQPDDPSLTEEEVLAHGGWHPRYARVLAVASDGDYGDYGDYGFAVVDGTEMAPTSKPKCGNGTAGTGTEPGPPARDHSTLSGPYEPGARSATPTSPMAARQDVSRSRSASTAAAITFPSAATSLGLHQSPHRPLRPTDFLS